MSFINNDIGSAKTYAPGFFLANNEDCTRETREAAQNSALVVTGNDGSKHIPMGTAYPTNDGNAIGIVYEDVDVTSGNMPCSVVTKGEVYEDRLAVTGAQYDAVTLKNLVSPKAQGWYESDGQMEPTYTLSTDETVNTSKTYYEKTGETTYAEVSDYAAVLNPSAEGWYERSGTEGSYVYTLSTDTEGDKTKTYYSKSDVRLASAAKSALEALGFKFIASAPAVTRPY